MSGDVSGLREHLEAWLDTEYAAPALLEYFREPSAAEPTTHPGRWFERLEGGGDRPPHHDHVTAGDLVAAQTLGVVVPAEVGVELLHGQLGRALSVLVSQVPIDVRLGDRRAVEHLASDAPAARAWRLLQDRPGLGEVAAGVILARKRPRLVPVLDSVVACGLGVTPGSWDLLQAAWTAAPQVGDRIAELRDGGRVPAEVGDLRVLDVVVRMAHRHHHRPGGCVAPGINAFRPRHLATSSPESAGSLGAGR